MVRYYMYENKKDRGHTGFQFFHGRQEDIPSITCVPPRTVRYVPLGKFNQQSSWMHIRANTHTHARMCNARASSRLLRA